MRQTSPLDSIIKASGETKTVWAARLDIRRSYLSDLCNGKKTPGLDLAVRIARATDGAVPVESWVTPPSIVVKPVAAHANGATT